MQTLESAAPNQKMAIEAGTSRQTAEYDISSKILPHIDRHLCLALLDFLDHKSIYDHNDLTRAKLDILKSTNLVNYCAQVDRELNGPDGNADLQKGTFSCSWPPLASTNKCVEKIASKGNRQFWKRSRCWKDRLKVSWTSSPLLKCFKL